MSDNLQRLVQLVHLSQRPLGHVLVKYAKKDVSIWSKCNTIHDYLKSRESEIRDLTKPRLTTEQIKKVFPQTEDADETRWDVTLIANLIKGLFGSVIEKVEKTHIKKIRSIRNDIKHKGTTRVGDIYFETTYTELTNSIVYLTKSFSASAQDIINDIDRIKDGNTPIAFETFHQWFDTAGCESVCTHVKNAVVERDTDTDHCTRFLIEDPVLEGMRNKFRLTHENADIPGADTKRAEVGQIQKQLETNHRVVVCGDELKEALVIALAAIIGREGFTADKCIELSVAYEWSHVNLNEIEIVLLKYPFGHLNYNKKKANDMFTVFDNMVDVIEKRDGKLVIVIVTEQRILEQAVRDQQYEHTMLCSSVCTSPKKEEIKSSHSELLTTIRPKGGKLAAMIGKTDVYLKTIEDIDEETSKKSIHSAQIFFDQYNVVVVTAVDRRRALQLAKKLITSTQTTSCLVITDPDGFESIQLNDVCILVIEDFAGKFRLNLQKAEKWYEQFDMIMAHVQERIIKVILTCEKDKLEKCQKEFGHHQLLNNTVHVEMGTKNKIVVDEKDNDDVANLLQQNVVNLHQRHVKPPPPTCVVEEEIGETAATETSDPGTDCAQTIQSEITRSTCRQVFSISNSVKSFNVTISGEEEDRVTWYKTASCLCKEMLNICESRTPPYPFLADEEEFADVSAGKGVISNCKVCGTETSSGVSHTCTAHTNTVTEIDENGAVGGVDETLAEETVQENVDAQDDFPDDPP